MNKGEYLADQHVINFIEWIQPRISGEIEFIHEYLSIKSKNYWSCKSVYNAYENYLWSFTCELPDGKKVKGHTFKESEELLVNIEKGMKASIRINSANELLLFSRSMLEWGGVLRSNFEKLENMGEDIICYFENAIRVLEPKIVDTNDNFNDIIMNSGFTKLYSLLIDDFVIYDSRVGAALGLLVRKYLEEANIKKIPDVLDFSYGNSRSTKLDSGIINKRNPSSKTYKFSQLANNDKKHIKNNIMANWLLGEVANKSKFRMENSPIRSLESAMFMLGYQVNDGVNLPD